jgi:N-hydroxyarylamine O-acetyltransferase
MRAEIDIDAYFERIGFAGKPHPDRDTLNELHLLHPIAIPFENLSTLLRAPIPLELPSLEHKLVKSRRGGYCFEQNRLFAAVLTALGFDVACHAARVVWGRREGPLGARTHMLLRVRVGAETLLSDVGFGGLTLTGPLRLEPDVEQRTPHDTFRLVFRDGEYELQAGVDSNWRAMYRFDLQPQLPIDFDVLNHFVSTHPTSHFLTTLMAARRTANGRYALTNNELSEYREGQKLQRRLGSADEIEQALSGLFEIVLPNDVRLRAKLESIAAQ